MNKREEGSILDLYAFAKSEMLRPGRESEAYFQTCIELMTSYGLIQRLSFGNLVLLQPETEKYKRQLGYIYALFLRFNTGLME